MSYDQKPTRIKLIKGGGPARVGKNAAAVAPAAEGSAAKTESIEEPPRGLSLIATILFLIGCAIGGAGIAAWPHLAS